jgi:hypothetical protein
MYTDAWEALAMTVEKIGNIDDALSLNRRYAELDHDAVMARSNLSRLYIMKGFKEKAEQEIAAATAIGFRLRARESKMNKESIRRIEEEQRDAEQAESRRKMKLFTRVLAMDPDDEVAHFGISKLYFEAG